MSKYAFGKTVNMSYEKAIEAVTQALAKEGFGVLTEIDVAATLKKKLGIDRAPYKILGACNPQFAARALEAEPQIGALLPCNVIVYEADDGKAVVAAVDPMQTMAAQQNLQVRGVAEVVRAKLEQVLARLE